VNFTRQNNLTKNRNCVAINCILKITSSLKQGTKD